MDVSVTGAVIREYPIRESDKLLTFLSAERGKITVLAKGVKNIKSKNAAGTQLFCCSELELSEKNGRYVLKTAYAKQSFFGIREDVLRYSLACYLADAANAVTTENSDEEPILRLFLNSLFALSEKKDVPLWKIKAAFELRLMVMCGFMPELYLPCDCEKAGSEPQAYVFDFTEARALCADCKEKRGGTVSLPKAVLESMRYVCACKLPRLLSFGLGEQFKSDFAFICENYLLYQTERSYETLKIYKSMSNTLK